MRNFISEDMRAAVKNWWVSLIIGILFLVMGLWMLFAPGVTFAALVIFFSVFMFVSGIFEIVFSLSNTRMHGWGWYLAVGIVDLLVGL
ncbi:MAG: DUF308 domain-containing protein, partial [Prevotella sp.]|nr:DUF308 domain-containing protein [Prevotella sp.]